MYEAIPVRWVLHVLLLEFDFDVFWVKVTSVLDQAKEAKLKCGCAFQYRIYTDTVFGFAGWLRSGTCETGKEWK